ncbi:MAG TPA: ParB/RepB/Spo0J family partition protein [Steroidobacteraceae bacterium]
MTTQSKTRLSMRNVPLSSLVVSSLNVRKKRDSKEELEELAALIEAEGVIQNLVGFESSAGRGKRNKHFEVVAGGRRLRALQLLQKRGKVRPSLLVPVREISKERAIAVSLAENSGRKELHPADAFEAFRALVDAGESIEEVAARFNVSPVTVQRRLKLANVAPEFIQMYRDKEILLDHLLCGWRLCHHCCCLSRKSSEAARVSARCREGDNLQRTKPLQCLALTRQQEHRSRCGLLA